MRNENGKKIKLCDGYYLKMDSFCMWIEEEYIAQRGKTKGENVLRRVTGYYRDYESLFKAFFDGKCRTAEANTAKQILKEMATERTKTMEMIKTLLKGE